MFGSCWKPGASGDQALDRIVELSPDMFLWLGDNIYGDTTDMTAMRASYESKKQTASYERFLRAEIPVLATWDDHDYGENNQGRYYTRRAESQQEFARHFDLPADDPRRRHQEGVYNARLFPARNGSASVHVILLDGRYHRSPTFNQYGACEGNASSFLGSEQWDWLMRELRRPADIKIIASGIQVLPPLHGKRALKDYCAYADGREFQRAIAALEETDLSGTEYESWAEFPLERERLLRAVQASVNAGNAKQVIFVSGDQHWAEIMRKDIPATDNQAPVTVYEVTASGFNQNWPYEVPDPNRLP
ncbi:MAG: alkaline phosphatase family protein, partial [Leptospiraceae bacterium]|nr:alkaline phosphatase family protein [Leptospiraceae bacterium]